MVLEWTSDIREPIDDIAAVRISARRILWGPIPDTDTSRNGPSRRTEREETLPAGGAWSTSPSQRTASRHEQPRQSTAPGQGAQRKHTKRRPQRRRVSPPICFSMVVCFSMVATSTPGATSAKELTVDLSNEKLPGAAVQSTSNPRHQREGTITQLKSWQMGAPGRAALSLQWRSLTMLSLTWRLARGRSRRPCARAARGRGRPRKGTGADSVSLPFPRGRRCEVQPNVQVKKVKRGHTDVGDFRT